MHSPSAIRNVPRHSKQSYFVSISGKPRMPTFHFTVTTSGVLFIRSVTLTCACKQGLENWNPLFSSSAILFRAWACDNVGQQSPPVERHQQTPFWFRCAIVCVRRICPENERFLPGCEVRKDISKRKQSLLYVSIYVRIAVFVAMV